MEKSMNYNKLLNRLKTKLDQIDMLQSQLDFDIHKEELIELDLDYGRTEKVYEKVFAKVFNRSLYN